MRRSTLTAFVLALSVWQAAAIAADRALVGGLVHVDGRAVPRTVLVDCGRITAVASPEDLEDRIGPGWEVVDLDGAVILPGLVDAHLHLTGLGQTLEEVRLVGATSWREAVERAEARAEGLEPEAWLEGRGWDQNLWPGASLPDRRLLDQRLPGRPVLLRRVDGHAAVASNAALRLAGIDRRTPDPPGGRIARWEDGEATGLLVDTAVDLVRDVIPEPSLATVKRRILGAAEALLEDGITQVHDAGTSAKELAVLRRLAAEGDLPIRVYVLLDGDDPGLLADELSLGPGRKGTGMLRVGGVKLYADGALGSRGALLGAEYDDDPGNTGLAVTSSDQLWKVIERSSEAGFQVAVHAIGDEGVHRVLDLYERLGPARCRRLRHRIEHSQIVRPGDVERFAALGVVASVQPTHCTSDMPWAPARLGAQRVLWAYRWRTLADSGAVLAGGSDAPVEDPDPRHGLYAAMTRQRGDGSPAEGWNPAERLGPQEALALFTSGAARAGHAETWSGEIRPGAVADLTVIRGDPLRGSPEHVLHLQVVRTIVSGEDRYVAEGVKMAEGPQ